MERQISKCRITLMDAKKEMVRVLSSIVVSREWLAELPEGSVFESRLQARIMAP